jgi:hypothetical protein
MRVARQFFGFRVLNRNDSHFYGLRAGRNFTPFAPLTARIALLRQVAV